MSFFQRQFQFSFNIAAATTSWTTSTRPTKQLFEDVETFTAAGTKATKIEVVKIEPTRAWSRYGYFCTFPSRRWRSGPGFNGAPVLAVLVVEFSILRAGKYVVRLL